MQAIPAVRPEIIMVASECRGLAKVGGLADVVRDLTVQLHRSSQTIALIMPRYSFLEIPDRTVDSFELSFGKETFETELTVAELMPGLPVYFVRQEEFFEGGYTGVYIDSSSRGRGPFEDDAKRFAFFSLAVATVLNDMPTFQKVREVHCHDWHTGILLALRALVPQFMTLRERTHTTFTVHNLDYQGVRPLLGRHDGRLTSLESWFPEHFNAMQANVRFAEMLDPTHQDCFNPMRAGLRLSEVTNTVSPNYAREITQRDDEKRGFSGGRGLQKDLGELSAQGRLVGILNGIDYSETDPTHLAPPFDAESTNLSELRQQHKRLLWQEIQALSEDNVHARGTHKEPRWGDLKSFLQLPLAVFVTRLAQQKVQLLFQTTWSGSTVIQRLSTLEANVLILGTGELEEPLKTSMDRVNARNLLLVNRFDPDFATRMYAAADLFFMPSLFEPCGISQLLAMRYGSLPVANEVGGLKDTIGHRVTGFLFGGQNHTQLAENFVETARRALDAIKDSPDTITTMRREAMDKRFTWAEAAREYLKLYGMAE